MADTPRAKQRISGAGLSGLFAAIFLFFAPLPVLAMSTPQRPFSPVFMATSAVVGGLIAISWAAVFVFERYRALLAVAPMSALAPWVLMLGLHRLGLAQRVAESAAFWYRSVYMLTAIASIVAGYFL